MKRFPDVTTLTPKRTGLTAGMIGLAVLISEPVDVVERGLGLGMGSGSTAWAMDRETEARIIAQEDRREVDATLLDLLSHEDAKTRGRAALALGRIGRSEDVARLASVLQDEDAGVREWAAFALGEIEDSTAAMILETHLVSGHEQNPVVRELAVEGLGKLGRGKEGCLAALRDGSEQVQARALLAAWRIPGATPVDEILQMSNHKKDELRWTAAYCLMRMAGAPASGRTAIPEGEELSDDDKTRIADRLLEMTQEEDARVLMQALRGLRTRPDEKVTARLLEMADHRDWRVRVETWRALTGTEEPRQIPNTTWSTGLEDSQPNVVAVVVEALAKASVAQFAETQLQRFLGDERPRIRELAVGAWAARLRSIEAQDSDEIEAKLTSFFKAVEPLRSDPQWTVRAACIGLTDLLPEEQRGDFLRPLTEDVPAVAKLAVGPYLEWKASSKDGIISQDVLQPELDRFLEADDPMVVLMAMGKLTELFEAEEADSTTGTPDWAPVATTIKNVRDRAQDPLWSDVRQAIAGEAGKHLEQPGMRDLVDAALDDPSFVVRREAVQALEEAGETPRRQAEPIDARHSHSDYLRILEWAAKDHRLVIETDAGTLEARLFSADAPMTCWNLAQLAQTGYFDDGAWHRVVPNFVLQDGCPRGDGWGGPGHEIRCEINRHRYQRGALGMALAGKDTGGSQFFFTHSSQPHLDGGYTVFGEIVRGRDVADRVAQGDGIQRIRVVND